MDYVDVVNQYRSDGDIIIGFCSKCFESVRSGSKGTDEECPNCKSELNWFPEGFSRLNLK